MPEKSSAKSNSPFLAMDSAGMIGAAKAAAARKRGRRERMFEVMRAGGPEDKGRCRLEDRRLSGAERAD
jgi:hypothetical protein